MIEPEQHTLAFPSLNVTKKSGNECFTLSGKQLDLPLLCFWQWFASNLASNATRGILAEFIFASALGLAQGVRSEWDAFDILTTEGTRIEVKSAAYLQSWAHAKLSKIVFTIRQTPAWSAETNQLSSELKRQADIYVFCVLAHQEKKSLDPLCLDQWEFYLLRSAVLDEHFPTQKTIGLKSLLKLNPVAADYLNLADRTAELAAAIRG